MQRQTRCRTRYVRRSAQGLAQIFARDFSLEKKLHRIEPRIDGSGVVALGTQSRRFPKKLASAFVEWLYALGAEVGVRWSAAAPVALHTQEK